MKQLNYSQYAILLLILLVLAFFYRRFEDKRLREENMDNDKTIQKYLLDDETLAKSKKPILWIHVPYEYNARHWLSWGSRSTYDLNQPYLYLTVRTIIRKCDDSFTICFIDDKSFSRLIPNWNIDMSKLSNPILENMRNLGLMKLLYIYGGMICPISFVCVKDLFGLYETGTRGDKMFVCENVNNNITSTTHDFYPSIHFCGANKENETINRLIDFIQRTNSTDYTAQSVFLGEFDRWINKRVLSKEINMIPGTLVSTKTVTNEPILIDDLMSNNYLNLYPQTYGIWVPADQILKRNKFEWFPRMDEKQVLKANTIISNYILVTLGNESGQSLEPLVVDQKPWVGFWKTPNYPGLYGLKPNFLGDNLYQVPYTGQ